MALTDARIKALKLEAKRYLVTDGRGLSLDVLPSGKRSWLYRYRLDGSYGKVILGRYPHLSLKLAREKRDYLAGQVAEGISPALEAKLAKTGKTINQPFRSLENVFTRSRLSRIESRRQISDVIWTMRSSPLSERKL